MKTPLEDLLKQRDAIISCSDEFVSFQEISAENNEIEVLSQIVMDATAEDDTLFSTT